MDGSDILVRAARDADRDWIASSSGEVGGPVVVSAGRLYDLRDHPGLVASQGHRRVGLLVFRDENGYVEVLAIQACLRARGVGTRLLDALERHCLAAATPQIRLCTTNDNLDALRFYQRRGFQVCGYRVGGFQDVLRLKGLDPDGMVVGNFGIVIRDVIELAKPIRLGRDRD